MTRGIPVDDDRFQHGTALLLAWQHHVVKDVDSSLYLYRDHDDTYYLQYIRGPGPERDLLFRVSLDAAQHLYRKLVALAPREDAFPGMP